MEDSMQRYARQMSIREIGEAGQRRLHDAAVLVVGAGGLGTNVLFALGAAGVGTIGIVDGDCVDVTNLNRQYLYDTQDIGLPKAIRAQKRIQDLNPGIEVIPYAVRLTEEIAQGLLDGYDLVVLAVDSLATRLLMNRVCHSRAMPLVDGGIDGLTGYVAAFQVNDAPCLQCFFGEKEYHANPAPGSLGAVVAVISSLEACLAIHFLLGKPNPLPSKILFFDAVNMSFDEVSFKKNPLCQVCGKP